MVSVIYGLAKNRSLLTLLMLKMDESKRLFGAIIGTLVLVVLAIVPIILGSLLPLHTRISLFIYFAFSALISGFLSEIVRAKRDLSASLIVGILGAIVIAFLLMPYVSRDLLSQPRGGQGLVGLIFSVVCMSMFGGAFASRLNRNNQLK